MEGTNAYPYNTIHAARQYHVFFIPLRKLQINKTANVNRDSPNNACKPQSGLARCATCGTSNKYILTNKWLKQIQEGAKELHGRGETTAMPKTRRERKGEATSKTTRHLHISLSVVYVHCRSTSDVWRYFTSDIAQHCMWLLFCSDVFSFTINWPFTDHTYRYVPAHVAISPWRRKSMQACKLL